MKKYKQITPEERYILSLLKLQAFSIARIADIMGKHRSTLIRHIANYSETVVIAQNNPIDIVKRIAEQKGDAAGLRYNKHYLHNDFEVVRRPLKK